MLLKFLLVALYALVVLGEHPNCPPHRTECDQFCSKDGWDSTFSCETDGAWHCRCNAKTQSDSSSQSHASQSMSTSNNSQRCETETSNCKSMCDGGGWDNTFTCEATGAWHCRCVRKDPSSEPTGKHRVICDTEQASCKSRCDSEGWGNSFTCDANGAWHCQCTRT